MLTRRAALGAVAGAIAGAIPASSEPQAGESAADSLGELAARKGLLFGAAMMRAELVPESQALFAREVRLITPSNEFKMAAVRPAPDRVDFSGADALMAFAGKHGLAIRGHTLIWNDWQPAWIHRLSRSEIGGLIDRHIELVVSRYQGRVHTWDVVNEPIGVQGGEADWLAPGPYLEALGQDYIARALRRARFADPKTKLFLNETHTERDDAFGRMHRKRLLRLIDDLQGRGVPLDGIGLQGHLAPPAPFQPEAFLAFCEQIAGRGLEIQITELDVLDTSFPDDIAARDALVARQYSRFLRSALQCRAVTVVATWHLADHFSYPYRQSVKERAVAARRPRPLLFDDRQQRKPAWYAVAQVFSEMPMRG